MNNKALIERLRDIGRMYDPTDTSEEAADALEACEARIKELEEMVEIERDAYDLLADSQNG